ncbi:MAG: NAD(P)H-dependent glycerol-3-phosphate dehydrogenase [Pseudomonadota bacterium]|nr:NAD(P)H-dependent glycerol-3-phosphate dehydrogenase [Pseudomonadota bacterium]
MSKIGILGAGAWGTALATSIERAGSEVVIQAHEPETALSINNDKINKYFLPDIVLEKSIRATNKIEEAIDADAVILASPAQHLRSMCERAAPYWADNVPAIICAKGIERDSCALMSEVVGEVLPSKPVAVLSGPTFAIEVARDLPTAVTLACRDEILGKVLMELLNTPHFRIYRSSDVIGAQIGGALKNVVAIACGIVEGKGLGENSRSAMVTRGLAEMIRLGSAKGAKADTLSGLSGLGDLALTCYSMKSRNFSLGVGLGGGGSLDSILGQRNSVAEGVSTASSVVGLARRLGVEVPICSAVNNVIAGKLEIEDAIVSLLSRPLKEETA